MARRRALDLHWTALLNDFRRSGLTHAEFCARRGLSLHTFRKHLYAARLAQPAARDGAPPPVKRSPFLPVTLRPDPVPVVARGRPALELILPDGRRIAVAPGFDPETLRRLIALVEHDPCSD